MNRRAFFELFAAAGLSALAPKAFAAAEFVTGSELEKLMREIRSSAAPPEAIRLPADVFDQVCDEIADFSRFSSAPLLHRGVQNVMVLGVPILCA